jgi:chromosome segregation ATPase
MTTMTSEAEERVAFLERLLGDLRAEHAAGPPERAALMETIARAEAETQRLAAEVDRLKAQAKQYKREVDDWKQWYHSRPAINRLVELARLQAEIQWRSAAIAAVEAKIGALSTAHVAAAAALEQARQRLAALEAGIYAGSIADDPRILAIMADLDAARAVLAA